MRRLFVLLVLALFVPFLSASAQDQSAQGQVNSGTDDNVVTFAPAEPAAPAAVPAPRFFARPNFTEWQISMGYQFNDYSINPTYYARFHTSGYDAAFVRYFTDWFGLEGQVGFGFGHTGTATIPPNLVAKSFFVGGGPHISFRSSGRLEPWAHGLVGVEHFRFTQTAGPYGSNSTLGWLVGGGVDYHLNSRAAIRGEGDYLGTGFFGQQHRNLQLVAGFVLNF